MSLPVRILIVEDDPSSVDDIEEALDRFTEQIAVEVATCAAEALTALDKLDFDLVVCDLAMPDQSGGQLSRTDAGLRVFTTLRNTVSGTPVIVFSGRASPRILGGFVNAGAGQIDVFGTGPRSMLQYFPKDDLPRFSEALAETMAEAVSTASIAIDGLAEDLTISEQRVLQVLAQRLGAVRAAVHAVPGGLSHARTFRVEVWRADGNRVGQLVAKLGRRERVAAEARKSKEVAPRLPVGLIAPLVTTVEAGSGRIGGAFYQVADDHDHSLFQLLSLDADTAGAVATTLHERFALTTRNAAARSVRFKELRRTFIADLELRRIKDQMTGLNALDSAEIDVSWCMQHYDLHGGNVLTNAGHAPVIIDFADVRDGPACVDPITLELSAIFHPDAPRLGWPSVAAADQWSDLDAYVDGSPIEAFVRACREWTVNVAASAAEIDAVLLAYALRQLKYDEPTAPIARALAKGAIDRLCSR